MWEWRRRVAGWRSAAAEASFSSLRHLWFMMPLFLVAGLVVFSGPRNSFLLFASPFLHGGGGDSGGGVFNGSSTPPSQEIFRPNNSSTHENLTSIPRPLLPTEHEETQNGTSSSSSSPTVDVGTTSSSSSRRYSKLEILEAGLARSRASILRGNPTKDDFIPNGPMYWNASAFHRSYLEMEKTLKVYVYQEGDPPVFHFGPCKHTYAIEGYFIQAMDVSPFKTSDPNQAHLFFLPFSVTMLTEVIYVPESHDWSLMKNTAFDYVNVVAHKYPFWNRSLGADHFMLACHDWGPEISFAIPNLHNNSIRALCNANTSERFDPKRDVSIPEIHLPLGTTAGLLGGPSPSKRTVLVFYSGGLHGPIRPILMKHWENKTDEDVQIHSYLPDGLSYYGMMRKSKYCICPSGYEVASPRMVEALYMGCVPVLIKEGYVIPFSDVLNWKAFAVIIPVGDIPNLKKILTGISQREYLRLQMRGVKMRRHFEINNPPKRYDVFHMILHSIWLRRLNIRVRDDVHHLS
ncbi:PREDICTED: probable glycosyltransferase At5g03795 isoform X2 [Ipomoea nil]|uniref:probable glycosyltransferase At5g03795 isoform X2 n=1 Tax=Ipomoea nil TaxID=35883 RepID=UPI000901C48A|nr:PREDICTED: probable glycosyltransferase At5g03795 isoform X2 [Ipomoea nil]